jgi:hypothetical protein
MPAAVLDCRTVRTRRVRSTSAQRKHRLGTTEAREDRELEEGAQAVYGGHVEELPKRTGDPGG